jgi:hypothetical protein
MGIHAFGRTTNEMTCRRPPLQIVAAVEVSETFILLSKPGTFLQNGITGKLPGWSSHRGDY